MYGGDSPIGPLSARPNGEDPSAADFWHGWQDLAADLDEARTDPEKAPVLLTMLSFGGRWRHAYNTRESLIASGGPAAWLPTCAERASQDKQTEPTLAHPPPPADRKY